MDDDQPTASMVDRMGNGPAGSVGSIAFIVVGVTTLLLVIGVLTMWRIGRVNTEAAWTQNAFEVIETIGDLRITVGDAETGQRGYLLTGQAKYLAPYDEALQRLPVLFEKFRILCAGNPRQEQAIAMIFPLVRQKFSELAKTIPVRTESGEDAAKAMVLEGIGRNLMVRISAALDGMLAEERLQLNKRFAAASHAEGQIGWLSVLGAVTATLFLGLAALMLRRERIARRLVAHLRQVAEATLAASNLTLRVRVSEALAARDVARERLESRHRLDALGQLAGGIAHNVNNVLQTISGACSLMLNRARNQEDIERLSTMALAAAERGRAVARRLLVFASRGNLQVEEVDLLGILGDLQELLNHTLSGTVAIELGLPPRLPRILVDQLQLETIVINLATNARDALPNGGIIRIDVAVETMSETAAAAIELPAGNYIRLSVRDRGIGMDARTLARSTEPFFTTKAPGDGTGLGLSMARGFVEQSGGKLDIVSEPGQGTTVTLWLPAMGQSVPAAAPPPLPKVERQEDTSVLVVEGNRQARELACDWLVVSKFTVHQAASCEEALSALHGGLVVDLLLSELAMPRRDGIELARAARKYVPGLPVIILTSHRGAAAIHAIEHAVGGQCTALEKPIRLSALPDEIMIALHRSRALPATLEPVQA